MTSLSESKLAHLEGDEQKDAHAMLMGLGLKYYEMVSHAKNVDITTLTQVYLGSLQEPSNATSISISGNRNRNPPQPPIIPVASPAPARAGIETKPESKEIISNPTGSKLCKWPFTDNASAKLALSIPNRRKFLDQGRPVRKRLAKEIYNDLSYGKNGIYVSQIPEGLKLLGIPIEKELEIGFHGKNQNILINLDRWQIIVKRCCIREEAKLDTYIPVPASSSSSDESKSNKVTATATTTTTTTADAFRNIKTDAIIAASDNASQAAITNNALLSTSTNTSINGKNNNFKMTLEKYRQQAIGLKKGQFAQITSRSIIDQFLTGPIGNELYTNPNPWWEINKKSLNSDNDNDITDEIKYNPYLQRAFDGDSDSDSNNNETLDAHDERLFLNALGMNIKKPKYYKNSLNIKDAIDLQSHPAVTGTGTGTDGNCNEGIKNKYTSYDKLMKQREIQRMNEMNALHAYGLDKKSGWIKKNGGWCADFGATLKKKNNNYDNNNDNNDVSNANTDTDTDTDNINQDQNKQNKPLKAPGVVSQDTIELITNRIKLNPKTTTATATATGEDEDEDEDEDKDKDEVNDIGFDTLADSATSVTSSSVTSEALATSPAVSSTTSVTSASSKSYSNLSVPMTDTGTYTQQQLSEQLKVIQEKKDSELYRDDVYSPHVKVSHSVTSNSGTGSDKNKGHSHGKAHRKGHGGHH